MRQANDAVSESLAGENYEAFLEARASAVIADVRL